MKPNNEKDQIPTAKEIGAAVDALTQLVTITHDGVPVFTPGENRLTLPDNEKLKKLFGSKAHHFPRALSFQLASVTDAQAALGANCCENDDRQFVASAVAEIAPRDAVESMLALQMVGHHLAAIRFLGLLARATTANDIELAEKGAARMNRAYTSCMEQLRKHRTGGKQTVTVQHVHVEDGGQAIVGNVQTGGGRKK